MAALVLALLLIGLLAQPAAATAAVPNVANAIFPMDTASTTSLTPTLTARFSDPDIGDTGTLDYQVCTTSACTVVLSSGMSGSGIANGARGSWTPPSSIGYGIRYWRVRGMDQVAGVGSWSAAMTLKVSDATFSPTGVDGRVSGIHTDATSTWLTGNFNIAGPNVGRGPVLTTSTGVVDAAFPRIDGGVVYSSVPDGSGGWFIGGSFTSVGGVERAGLAQITSAGAVGSWAPAINSGYVRDMALNGTTLYVAGTFSTIDGQTANRLEAISTTTGAPSAAFDVGTGPLGLEILTISYHNTRLYLGGNFSTINGQARSQLAAVSSTTGAVDATWNPGANNTVDDIIATAGGVYVGGNFSIVAGAANQVLAKLDPVTGADIPAFAAAGNGSNTMSDVLLLNGSWLYSGGSELRRYDTTTGAKDATWDGWLYGGSSGTRILALATDGTWLYTSGTELPGKTTPTWEPAGGGRISLAGGTVDYDPSWWPLIGVSNGTRAVYTISVSGTRQLWGGSLEIANGTLTSCVTKLNSATGAVDAGFSGQPDNSGCNGFSTEQRVTGLGTRLYLAGQYSSPSRLIAVNATTGAADAGFVPTFNGAVSAIATDGTWIYAGGSFTTVNGTATGPLVALNPATGALRAGWNPNVVGAVRTLSIGAGQLWLGGTFTSVAGQPRTNIAGVSLAAAALHSFNLAANSTVNASAWVGATSRLAISGYFTSLGATATNGFAVVDPATSATIRIADSSTPSSDPIALAATAIGDVWSGADSGNQGGATSDGLTRWDTDSAWAADARLPRGTGPLGSALNYDSNGRLWVGLYRGSFWESPSNVGGRAVGGYFRYTPSAVNVTITDNQPGDTTWRSTNVAVYDVDAASSVNLSDISIRYVTGAGGTGTFGGWTSVASPGATTYNTNFALPGSVWAALPQGISYISLRAETGSGETRTRTDVFEVRKDTAMPTAVGTLNASTPTIVAPALTWTAATDALSGMNFYSVYRSTTGCGGAYSKISADGAVTGTSYTDAAAPYSATLCYRVQAVDMAGNERTVGNATRAVIYHRAPTVALATPAGGATNQPIALTLTATHSDPDADTGTIGFQVCSDAACTSVVRSGSSAAGIASGANGSWIVAPVLANATTYYWRAMTTDSNGATSAWTATRSFTTIAALAVTSTNPNTAPQGRRALTVQVNGAGFVSGATVAISGAGISVTGTAWVNSTRIDVTIDITGAAALGARNVTVTNPDLSTATGIGIFTITAPAITLTFSSLGYTDGARDAIAPFALSLGALTPGMVRSMGPAASGQTLAGPAFRLGITTDTTTQIEVSSGQMTNGSNPIPYANTEYKPSASGTWNALAAAGAVATTDIAPGTTTWDYDYRLTVPAGQTSGSYSQSITWTVIAKP